MLSRTTGLLVAGSAFVVLVGCGDGGSTQSSSGGTGTATAKASSSAAPGSHRAQPFEVTEAAYQLSPGLDSGTTYVEWAAVIRNPNSGYYGTFPVLTITAYDSSGAVLGTDDQTLNSLPPGATESFASQLTASGHPARVEIKYSKVDWYPTKTTASQYPPFGVSGATYRAGDFDKKVTGTLNNPYAHDWDELAVTALYRDASGKLIGGATSFLDNVPATASKPFEI